MGGRGQRWPGSSRRYRAPAGPRRRGRRSSGRARDRRSSTKRGQAAPFHGAPHGDLHEQLQATLAAPRPPSRQASARRHRAIRPPERPRGFNPVTGQAWHPAGELAQLKPSCVAANRYTKAPDVRTSWAHRAPERSLVEEEKQRSPGPGGSGAAQFGSHSGTTLRERQSS